MQSSSGRKAQLLRALSDFMNDAILQIFSKAGTPLPLAFIHSELTSKGIKISKPGLVKHLHTLVESGLVRKKKHELWEPLSTDAYEEIYQYVEEIEQIIDIGQLLKDGERYGTDIKLAIENSERQETAKESLRPVAKTLLGNDYWKRLIPKRKKSVLEWAILSDYDFNDFE